MDEEKVDIKEMTKERFMTTKEIANVCGVDEKTIRRAVEKLGVDSTVHPLKTNGGVQNVVCYNQQQATLIKQEIAKHHNLVTRQIDTVKTDVEILQNMQMAFLDFKELCERKEKELQNKIAQQEQQLVEQKPKVDYYDAIISSGDAIDMGAVAKTIGGIGRNKLFEFLREREILNKNNIPYQRYIDAGYFKTVECKYTIGDETKIAIKTVVFQKGVEFIKKLIESENNNL